MEPAQVSLEDRTAILLRFIRKYTQRGFTVVTRTPTTVELFRPARFPGWLFREQSIYLDIDETGTIYLRKT